MNTSIPASLVHGQAEMKSQKEAMREMLADKAAGKYVDKQDMQDCQARIHFLKVWVKREVTGVDDKCAGCYFLTELLRECESVLPEKWKKAIWIIAHKSPRLNVGIAPFKGAKK